MKRSRYLLCWSGAPVSNAIVPRSSSPKTTYFSYANLFVVFLHELWTNQGRSRGLWDLCVCTFEPSSWYLDISTVGEMVLSIRSAYQKGHLVLVRNLEIRDSPIGLNSIIDGVHHLDTL
jgi:hypothetical protein